MRARVIVTTREKRKDENVAPEGIPAVGFNDLFKYDELILTGGEPMVICERLVELVHRLRLQGYKGKIYLYTANSHRLNRYWAVEMLIDEVDGITYTVRDNKNYDKLKSDFTDLRRLDRYLSLSNREGKEDRLYIDSRVYSAEYVESVEYKWQEIKPFVESEADIPEGEDIIYYDVEGDNG